MLILGMEYTWSIFVAPLENEFGWLRSQTSITFSLVVAHNIIGSIISGILIKRYNPKIAVFISTILIFTGFMLVSRTNSLLGLYIFFGVFCALAIGMSYNAIITTIVPWFNDTRGTITGILLMAFGLSSTIYSPLINYLINLFGWRNTFKIIGVMITVALLIAIPILKSPGLAEALPEPKMKKKRESAGTVDVPPREMLRNKTFWYFVTWKSLISCAGTSIIGHAAPIIFEIGGSITLSTIMISMFSFISGIARVSSGILWDRISWKKVFWILSVICIIGLVFCLGAIILSSPGLFIIGSILSVGSYSMGIVVNSTFSLDIFGRKYYSLNHGLVNCSGLVNALIGPGVVGLIRTSLGSYLVSFVVLLLYAGASLIFLNGVKKS